MGLAVILIISDIGVTTTSFTATETCANNTFHASSAEWMQTTQSDFEAGILSEVDAASGPGHAKLSTTSDSHNRIFGIR